jgi:ABC-type sugar transport system permease subunit
MAASIPSSTSVSRLRAKAKFFDCCGNFMFIVPTIFFFGAFSLYPIIRTIQLSLYKWDGISPEKLWVGLRNFEIIFTADPNWWTAMWNATKFAILGVLVMQSFSLLMAILVDKGAKAESFYKVVYYIPTILSPMVVGYVWKWIYDPYGGVLNFILKQIGASGLSRAWLSDPVTSLFAVSLASIWAGFGYSFLLFLAALKGIPAEVYEAAKVDGANAWQAIRRVVLPMLRPIMTVVTILTILGAMQLYPLVAAMTNGGPGFSTQVPVMTIFNECFQSHHYGYASALSILFGVILLIISMAQIELSKRYDM